MGEQGKRKESLNGEQGKRKESLNGREEKEKGVFEWETRERERRV